MSNKTLERGRVSLVVNKIGAPSVQLFDPAEKRRISLNVAPEEGAVIYILDASGKLKWGRRG